MAPASGGAAKQLVIFLHGVGADGNDLIGLAPYFQQVLPDARFISPNAPFPFDMAPQGYQWFSLQDFTEEARLAGADRAAPILNAFIDSELAKDGLSEENLALIGFSQGAMMSLHVGLRREKQLAAIISYSGLLVGKERLETEIKSKPPVLLTHGTVDPGPAVRLSWPRRKPGSTNSASRPSSMPVPACRTVSTRNASARGRASWRGLSRARARKIRNTLLRKRVGSVTKS